MKRRVFGGVIKILCLLIKNLMEQIAIGLEVMDG